MGTMANSEDPEEMPHKVSFRQGLHCLQRQNRSSKKEILKKIYIETCHPSIYIMHNTDFIIYTGPRSAVGNVSGYRCKADCRSRGREFDPGSVPYFRGD